MPTFFSDLDWETVRYICTCWFAGTCCGGFVPSGSHSTLSRALDGSIIGHVEGGGEVVDAVEEQARPAPAGIEEGPPPPVVVFGAQVEVDEHNGDLRARDGQDDGDDGEEPEDIVDLVEPQGRQHEVHLNERRQGRTQPGGD